MYFLHFLSKDACFSLGSKDFYSTFARKCTKYTKSKIKIKKMKKIYMTMLTVLAFGAVFAQNNLTLRVDMAGLTVSANGVHVAGSFQGWSPSATAMTQVGATSVYTATVSVANGNYEFKFINGDTWNDAENVPNECNVGGGNSNRWITVRGATTTADILFGGCAPTGQSSVMFLVDMSTQGSVNDTISVAGSFQGWSPGTTLMTDWFGDSIYRAMGYVTTGSTVAFKYVNGASWGVSESVPGACAVGGNRELVASSNVIAGPVCYSQCVSCFIPDTFDVTIRVDLQNVCGTLDSVEVAGDMNGWSGGDMMTNMGSGIWEITVRMPEPSFKYKVRYYVDGSSNVNWEGGADKEPVFSSDTVLPVRCLGSNVYGSCVPKPTPADITFRVDFSQSPITPASTIYLIGDFTQWQTNAIALTPMVSNPGVYETVVTGFCPAEIFFKFVNGDVAVPANEENPGLDSCGVPSGNGGFNRYFLRPDGNPHTLQFIFDSCQALYIGLDENMLAEVAVTPNPFSTYATIDLGEGNYAVRIMDITGRLVREVKSATGTVTIDRGTMTSGVYFLTVIGNNGETRTSKFIVE